MFLTPNIINRFLNLLASPSGLDPIKLIFVNLLNYLLVLCHLLLQNQSKTRILFIKYLFQELVLSVTTLLLFYHASGRFASILLLLLLHEVWNVIYHLLYILFAANGSNASRRPTNPRGVLYLLRPEYIGEKRLVM